eukprot:GABU01004895.1.p1 GENE.GABU01004895.1~~GABU01004895.1.p1  ORF type:complete len:303 (-),score=76.10 GABU01004895.1:5-913(-)
MRTIGKGSYGVVYRATKENSPVVYAIKALPRSMGDTSSKESELLKQEVELHKTLKYFLLTELHASLKTERTLYLVMEYCKDGDLQGKLNKYKKLPESEALYYLKQIMSGLKYLVNSGIMHRDIKPANLLLSDDLIKVSDFGLAKKANETATSLGTPLYMAPEIIFGQQYDNKIDIWSVGCIYYELLFGVHPFDSSSHEQLQYKIRVHEKKGQLEFPAHTPVSDGSKGLLNMMLKVNPANRASWDEVFNHPVLSKNLITNPSAPGYFAKPNQARVESEFQKHQKEIRRKSWGIAQKLGLVGDP